MMKQLIAVASVAVIVLIIGLVFALQPKPMNRNSVTQDNKQEKKPVAPDANKLEGTKLANFAPVSNVDSLQKIDTVVGTGEQISEAATVTVHYTGAIASTGVIFQSSKDTGSPVTFPLSGVIAGWTQGVPGMRVGGTRRLLIPSELAYGESGSSSIPPNSDLVFDIEMVSTE